MTEIKREPDAPRAQAGLLQVSTDAVGPRDKIAFWRDLVCQHLLPAECRSIAEPKQFRGQIQMRNISTVALAHITSTAQSVTRTPQLIAKAGGEQLLVIIQRQGNGGVQQDGRLAALQPGEITLCSSAQRYDLSFNAPFSQTVLIVPTDQLRLKIPTSMR
jgi:hypothetical protein